MKTSHEKPFHFAYSNHLNRLLISSKNWQWHWAKLSYKLNNGIIKII